jgi:hypothetical protein
MSFAVTGAASSWESMPWKAVGFYWKSHVAAADLFQHCDIRNSRNGKDKNKE